MTEERTTLDSDDLFSLLAEVINGIGADKSTLPNTPLVRAKRAQLQKEVDEIIAKGGVPFVPHE